MRSDDDHRGTVAEIERLWDVPDGSPEADKLDVLATLVDVYEARRWRAAPGTSRDVLARKPRIF